MRDRFLVEKVAYDGYKLFLHNGSPDMQHTVNTSFTAH